jgi:DNA-binding protein HU-beta
LNRRELVAALAERTGAEKKATDAFLTAFTEVVTETVSKGEPVAISGFAKFARVERAARVGRNPATGEQYDGRGRSPLPLRVRTRAAPSS